MSKVQIVGFLLAICMIVGNLERSSAITTAQISAEQQQRMAENNQRFAQALAGCLNGGTLIESGRVVECKPKRERK